MRVGVSCVAVFAAVVVQAQPPDYSRGDLVRVHAADGRAASPEVQKVIAVPGDKLKIEKGHAAINGQALALSPELLATCGKWNQTVPAGHYVLAGEQVSDHSAVRSCSLLPASRISGFER